jgi:uncharacterized protein (DUF1015 family)
MVDIRPFRAIRYTKRAGDPENLITQPYDKIDDEMQKEYYKKSEYNYCRLVLPVEKNKYETARERIQKWMREGILAKDEEPAVFVYREEFELYGRTCIRTGLISALRLYPYSENVVFPHEVTYGEPKADRLNMLRTVQKDLEPVFLIFSDPENRILNFFADITKTQPAIKVEDSFRVKHAVWRVIDPRKIKLVQKALESKPLVITDGHHRYESALTYRDERRKQERWTEDSAFNFHMSYMVPIQDQGLIILPTHRLLKNFGLTSDTLQKLSKFFAISEIDPAAKAIEDFLESHKKEHAVCVYDGAKAYGLLLKNEKTVSELVNTGNLGKTHLLDVAILRDVVFKAVMKTGELKIDEDILYAESTRIALEKVDDGEAKLAFLVNCIDPETVWQIAQEHKRLPEKSTDFYPKPVSGLMMMDVSPEEEL